MPDTLPLDDIPTPDVLRQLREEIGLSQDGLAYELGLAKVGADIVRGWERGERGGKPCRPTLAIWRCFRLLVVASRCVNMGGVTLAVTYLRAHIPEDMR